MLWGETLKRDITEYEQGEYRFSELPGAHPEITWGYLRGPSRTQASQHSSPQDSVGGVLSPKSKQFVQQISRGNMVIEVVMRNAGEPNDAMPPNSLSSVTRRTCTLPVTKSSAAF